MSLEASLAEFLSQQIPGAKPEVHNLVQMSGGTSREIWSFEVAWTEQGREGRENFTPDAGRGSAHEKRNREPCPPKLRSAR